MRSAAHGRAAARVAWHAAAPTLSRCRPPRVSGPLDRASPPICFGRGRAPRGAPSTRHAPCLGAGRPARFRRVGPGHGAARFSTAGHRPGSSTARSMASASAPTSNRSWCRPCSPATSSLPTISGPTRSPASNAPSRLPGPPSGTCHPIARTSIPSSSASRSSRPSFAPLAVAAPRRSGRSSASAWRTSALTNAATRVPGIMARPGAGIFGTAGTRPPHGHEKRFNVVAVEDGAALVPGQEHGDPFGDVRADQVAGGGTPTIVKEAGRHPSRLAGGAPRRAPASDRDAVAVEDEWAGGVAACPPSCQRVGNGG